MSPSSSAAPLPSHVRSRQSSNATPVQDPSINTIRAKPSSRPSSPIVPPSPTKPPPTYTVFIRLPFFRGDFQDPSPTNWNSAKDRQLWKIISKASSSDLDWAGLSQQFDVELSFLLMQAAWLTERHMERMRRQVGRIGGVAAGEKGESSGSGLAPGGSSIGGVKMERTGSRESKMPSSSTATTVRRGSPAYPSPAEGGVSPGSNTPKLDHPPISRSPSSATVTQSKITASLAKQQPRQRTLRGSSGSGRRPTPIPPPTGSPKDEYYEDAIEHEGPEDSDSEEEPSAMTRSQAFRRPPPSRKAKPSLGTVGSEGDEEGDDDDDDSSNGYLPFAAASKPGKEDPAATLRSAPKKTTQKQPATTTAAGGKTTRPKDPIRTMTAESSASSASSAMHRQMSTDSDNPIGTRRSSADMPTHHRRASADSTAQRPPGPISPRHRAQLASLSPRFRKEGSEGSPSMGSSFSDLDDASVTQSALEDALMSNMRAQGGSTMASRMSSLRDALGRRGGNGQ